MASTHERPRRLVLVLGDQLDRDSAAFEGFERGRDAVWMAEAAEESAHVPAHKLRIAAFLSAMRRFRDALRERDVRVHYTELGRRPSDDRAGDLAGILERDVAELRPESLVVIEPGDHRVLRSLEEAAERLGVPLEVRADDHFLCPIEEFREWARGRRSLLLESFYRHMRRRHGVLLDEDGGPRGGRWNFDHENRGAFPRGGPGDVKAPRSFRPDATTRSVTELVAERFADHPGSLEHVDLPVTRRQALAALRDFVEHRLPLFGRYQDAMWSGRPYLHHSRLSFALNVHLLRPRECIDAAVEALDEGHAPIEAVEGFIRQLLGWREFVRGVYWTEMPRYARRNALRCPADADVPPSFWDGETDLECVRQAMRQVLDHSYAHHIQRLMVLGLLAQLLGVHPLRFHEWHLAMYADAVDWVSLPNTLGMSQYGDGGIVGTKPYCATGRYIDRMSDYCRGCPYDPAEASGGHACPFTALYWDFLARHRKLLEGNHRMGLQLRNLDRKDGAELRSIRRRARAWKRALAGAPED